MDYSPFPINLPVEKTPAAVITPNREQLHQIYSVANKHFDVVFDDKTAPHQNICFDDEIINHPESRSSTAFHMDTVHS